MCYHWQRNNVCYITWFCSKKTSVLFIADQKFGQNLCNRSWYSKERSMLPHHSVQTEEKHSKHCWFWPNAWVRTAFILLIIQQALFATVPDLVVKTSILFIANLIKRSEKLALIFCWYFEKHSKTAIFSPPTNILHIVDTMINSLEKTCLCYIIPEEAIHAIIFNLPIKEKNFTNCRYWPEAWVKFVLLLVIH